MEPRDINELPQEGDEVRDTLIISLRHNGRVSIKRENRFSHRPEEPIEVPDPTGTGYAWFEGELLESGSVRQSLALEGTNGNITIVDMRLVVQLIGGFLQKAGQDALKLRPGGYPTFPDIT